MATVPSNEFKELILKKVVDFANDSFKIILMESGFAFSRSTMDVYADVSANELATAYGYTAGGVALSGVAITRDDVNNRVDVTWTNPTWTASGGNIVAQGAIIFDDTVSSPVADPIIGYIDFGGESITYSGGVLTIANVTVRV